MPTPPADRNDFTVALICALPVEAEAVLALLDHRWADDAKYAPAENDSNAYTLGSVGDHHVVVVHMPAMGTTYAAGVAVYLKMSFPNIELAVVVGVCGGVPGGATGEDEVMLGDVMISSSLIQYDSGREYPNGFQVRSRVEDTLSRGNPGLRAFINRLRTEQYRRVLEGSTKACLRQVQNKVSATKDPGIENDRLFDRSYAHQHQRMDGQVTCYTCHKTNQICREATEASCDQLGCEDRYLVTRKRLRSESDRRSSTSTSSTSSQSRPAIFFTTMASGNKVMKSAKERDRLAQEMGVGAFEMEGAGVWQYIPTIVVKGVVDYADAHKNKRFQRFAAATAAACTKALLMEKPSTNGQRTQAPKPTAWTVPFTGQGTFIGRQEEIQALQSFLLSPDGPRRAAVVGPAGVGKTRLALEIASMARAEKPSLAVFWVQATDLATVERDFLEIGKALGIPCIEKQKADVVAMVQRQLSKASTGDWLFILDNADDESLWEGEGALASRLPHSVNGSLLITTRTRRVGFQLASQSLVDLYPMNENEALRLMRQTIANINGADDTTTLITLLQKLSYFPLAIVQAAAYMVVNGNTPAEYLQLLHDGEENVTELLEESFRPSDRYVTSVNSILSTWIISFEQIRRRSPLAVQYLSFMCCLNENQIPKTLLDDSQTPKARNDAIGMLKAYSLIFEQDSQFTMHNLVRLATRNWLRKERRFRKEMAYAVAQVFDVFPGITWESRFLWTSYLPHAQVICDSTLTDEIPKKYALLKELAVCMRWNGGYRKAVENLDIVAEWEERQYGKKHERVWDTYIDLGHSLRLLGDLDRSERYLQYAYRHFLREYGPQDLETLRSMVHLALTYSDQARYAEAEDLLARMLEIHERIRAPEDSHTRDARQELASIYAEQGRHREAEAITQKLVHVTEMRLGPDHPATLAALGSLAVTYEGQGRFAEAEDLSVRVLEGQMAGFGPEHPLTLTTMHRLAFLYLEHQRYEEAESLLTTVVEASNRVLGLDHPDSLSSLSELAQAQRRLGKLPEAVDTMARCVDFSIRKLGREHVQTQNRMWDLDSWTQELKGPGLHPDDARSFRPRSRTTPSPQASGHNLSRPLSHPSNEALSPNTPPLTPSPRPQKASLEHRGSSPSQRPRYDAHASSSSQREQRRSRPSPRDSLTPSPTPPYRDRNRDRDRDRDRDRGQDRDSEQRPRSSRRDRLTPSPARVGEGQSRSSRRDRHDNLDMRKYRELRDSFRDEENLRRKTHSSKGSWMSRLFSRD